MYINRLGQHFAFQSAQRLVVARVEELCIQSVGKYWLLIIDKIDQNACELPTVWPLMRTSFFKEGQRLQVSLNGCWFFGPSRSPELLIRTMFEDCPHGSNMQSSTLLLNLHDRAIKEQTIPEELFINADNTPKETKNNTCIDFAIWLLIVLQMSPLHSIVFLFLLVGHTHNKLDRFFSRIKIALTGRTYYTMDEMINTLHDAISGFTFDFQHLSDVWDFKEMEKACDLPHIRSLERVHAINVFRHGGCICVKWKQYLTSDTWSKPIVVVPPHLMSVVGAWRPQRVVQQFQPETAAKHQAWLNKLEVMLAESGNDDHKTQLESLRMIVRQTDQRYANKFDINAILADLMRIGGTAPPKDDVLSRALPEDALVQFFPGADHPPMPPDLLMHIEDRWTPEEPAPIGPGSLVVCKSLGGASAHDAVLPFTLGVVVAPLDPGVEDDVILQWWVPPLGKETVAGGRHKKAVDIFGQWCPYVRVALEDAGHYKMPAANISKESILIGPIELDDGKLPFATLDALIDTHGIDITGLRWTRTKLGSVYRSYRLYNH